MKNWLTKSKVFFIPLAVLQMALGAQAEELEKQNSINQQIPNEVVDLMTMYPKQLSLPFLTTFPIVVAEFQATFLATADKNKGVCTKSAEMTYDGDIFVQLLKNKNITLTETDRDFLDSISIIKGCTRFLTEDTNRVMSSLLIKEYKMGFAPDIKDFYKDGDDFCEIAKVSVLFSTMAQAHSCYRVLWFDSPVTNMKAKSFTGFTSWEVKSESVDDFEPIYFRSTVMFANANSDKSTNLNFLIVSRWNSLNALEKEIAQNYVPSKIADGFTYLRKILNKR